MPVKTRSVTAREAFIPDSSPFRFLDLPTELRSMIFGHFETIPGNARYGDEGFDERRKIIETRKSLLSVSRQINGE